MHKNPPKISALIIKCRKKDQFACRQLYEAYKNSLFSTCLRYSNSEFEAEDYLQEGFINIFKNIVKYDESKGAFYTWANRVIINCILVHKRKKKLIFNELGKSNEIKPDLNSNGLDNLQYSDLMKAINELPNGFKTVFNLYEIEGFSHSEIAEQLGISVSTSKTQLMRAKAALRSLISQQDEINIHAINRKEVV